MIHQDIILPLQLTEQLQNRPYLYSQFWTGTSLQLRLMWRNIIKKSFTICICIFSQFAFPRISLHCKNDCVFAQSFFFSLHAGQTAKKGAAHNLPRIRIWHSDPRWSTSFTCIRMLCTKGPNTMRCKYLSGSVFCSLTQLIVIVKSSCSANCIYSSLQCLSKLIF